MRDSGGILGPLVPYAGSVLVLFVLVGFVWESFVTEPSFLLHAQLKQKVLDQ